MSIIERQCDYCGQVFKLDDYRVKFRKNVFCSVECTGRFKTKSFIVDLEKQLNQDLRQWFHENYTIRYKTFRQICDEININERTLSKLLKYYNIEIRHGSESIKTQWVNNHTRKLKQAEFIKEVASGKTNKRLDKAEIVERLNKKDINFVSIDYENNKGYITYSCRKCGYKGRISITNLNYKGCAGCKQSKGEQKIAFILDKLGIEYLRQYKIKECKLQMPLPFDFAVIENSKLVFLIEYDGDFHYKPFKKGDEISLKKTIERDNIKTQYCISNNIDLLRIPFWDYDNIENIINNQINKHELALMIL